MTTSTELHYAPKPPLLRRTRVRAAFAFAAIVALASAGLLWGKPAWAKVQLLYWQARCMSHIAPQDRVVAAPRQPGQVPAAWARFYKIANSSSFLSRGTVFLHERRSQAGARRLVALDLAEANSCVGGGLRMVSRVFVPASAFSSPREIIDWVGWNEAPVMPNATFFAGQPDPEDSSHFVIRYAMAGKEHVMDGWLTDDDKVLLEHRGPPVALVTP